MSTSNLTRLIPMLEKVSALTVANNPGLIARLEESINYASILDEVNVDGVEPLYHLDEGGKLYLQEDKAEPQDKIAVMANAKEKMEDYFVAPMSVSLREVKGKSNEYTDEKVEASI